MLSSALLEGAVGSRGAVGGSLGSALALLQRAALHSAATRQPTPPEIEACCAPEDGTAGAGQASCSSRSSSSGVCVSTDAHGVLGKGSLLGALQHDVLMLLQRRGVCTTSSASYEFQSNLTRYAKSKVANRDNFQRWRESGRDVRVAREILDESRPAGRRGRREARRDAGQDVMAQLRSFLLECRNLKELQAVLRECLRDLDGPHLCLALSRLHKLKAATPPADAPDALARRIAESLMLRLQDRQHEVKIANLGSALYGLAECGVVPGRPLLEAVVAGVTAASPRGGWALTESEPRATSNLVLACSKLMSLQRQQQRQQQAAGAVVGEDVLREQLWPALLQVAEAKVLRALGEEPEGAPAAPVGGENGPEVDDSMPQAALRDICRALGFNQEKHPGVWTAIARLCARHASELEPAIAASVLRSYAMAGGAALDGGSAGLLDAVWSALEPQLGSLDAAVLIHMTAAAALLAAKPAAAPGGADADAAIAATAATAQQVLRPLCSALLNALPRTTCAAVTSTAKALARAHGATTAGEAAAAPAAPQPHSFGALPRLMGEQLLLRGVEKFGARDFASVALALGIMGHADASFWSRVGAVALKELPHMDASGLSRLLGAFHHASLHAAAAAPAAPLLPDAAILSAAHTRVVAVLDDGSLTAREALFVLQAMANWPLPGGGAATLARLADRIEAAAAGEGFALAGPSLERLAAALRKAGLGEHALLKRIQGLGA